MLSGLDTSLLGGLQSTAKGFFLRWKLNPPFNFEMILSGLRPAIKSLHDAVAVGWRILLNTK